tara:strand:+ start:427 stop:627 length:201 start_codon:yes stop_codon:yes gene_type:complete
MTLQELTQISRHLTLEDLAVLLELNKSRLIIVNTFEDGSTSQLSDVESIGINEARVQIDVEPLEKG